MVQKKYSDQTIKSYSKKLKKYIYIVDKMPEHGVQYH